MGIVDRTLSFAREKLIAYSQVEARVATPVVEPPPAFDRGYRTPIASADPDTLKYPIVLGPGMNPSSINAILREADRGYMHRLCDLLSEQRSKVTHLQAVLGTREKAVGGRKWTVNPRDVAQLRGKRVIDRAEQYAEYVRSRIEKIPRFADMMEHLAGGAYFGRSGVEIVWDRDGRGVFPSRLIPIHPKRFSYADSWDIHLYDQFGNNKDRRLAEFPGIDLHAEYPGKFITHEPKTNGCEVPTRQGLGYQLVYPSMFWLWDQRDWMQYAELFAKPWRIGTYDKTAEGLDIEGLRRALERLGGSTTAVLPEGADVKLVSPQNAENVHEKIRVSLNAEFSKVVLGQTTTTELGDVGSYASTKVHDLVRLDILRSDGISLSETIQTMLVRPLVRWTFGQAALEECCPQFTIITDPQDDLSQEVVRVCSLVDRGMVADMDEVRERYTGLKAPAAGSKLLEARVGGQPSSGVPKE